MENKKYLPLKIIHLIFMVLGVCFYLYSFWGLNNLRPDTGTGFVILIVLQIVTAIFALISGILYLTHGYKKNAAAYFKGYVWILLINEILAVVLESADLLLFYKFVCAIGLVLLTILTVGKDLGKVKSFTLVGLILIGKIILLISYIDIIQINSTVGINMVLGMVGQIIIASTTGLMVCGKYLDKAERGTK